MDASIKKTVRASDKDAQYDEKAKKLLGHKIILAYILVNTIEEFREMNPKEVVNYIEGEPYISVIPVDSGMTNGKKKAGDNPGKELEDTKTTEQVSGLNTENSEINEGMIRFDIIFYVRMKDGLTQIIINVEAQKEEPRKYKIVNRAIFYICRIVSSQKGRDFVNSEYDDMKRVYSIWICMNMKEHSLSHIHLEEEQIIGSHKWKGDLDLLNIIIIGIAKNLPEKEEKYELHRLLSALLSSDLEVEDKLDIMEKEYDIPLENDIRKDVKEMCNLSQGIREEAFEEGQEYGYREGQEKGEKQKEKICKPYANRASQQLGRASGNGFFICGGLGHDTGTDDDQQTGDCRGEKCSADATRKISNSNLLKLQCWADNGRNCNMYESAGQYGENKNPKGKINFKTGIGGERN